ncbi:MAG: hypothetical protein ACWA45_09835 [Flavobacteriales bacterium]
MKQTNKFKKFFVITFLFLLPITAYLFFASGVNHFAKLPVLMHSVSEIHEFKSIDGEQVLLKNHISVLGFFGKELLKNEAYAFNLAHKIYKKNYQFKDFQTVIVLPEEARVESKQLEKKLKQIENTNRWKFVFGNTKAIKQQFNSLKTTYHLDHNLSTPFVFIIDKDLNLRGRNNDEDIGILYGYDASNYSEINNKMGDDIKVILAEYRLALKKYNTQLKK